MSPWTQEGIAGAHAVVRVLKESRTKSLVPLPPLKPPTVQVPVAAPLHGGEAGGAEHFEIHSGSEGEVKVEIESESDSD